MKLIKLCTTESTNLFLKELVKTSVVENFTVIVTDAQTKGRGQMDGFWSAKPFRNLTFSVFVEFKGLSIKDQKYLNFAVSLAIFDVLNELKLPKITIKWPNDILSENKKIGGILIENKLQQNKITSSIIGIGLNVNQTNFTKLPKANSLKNIMGKEFNLELLLEKIIKKLKNKIYLLEIKKYEVLETEYFKNLYKYLKPSMFIDKKEVLFMAKIIGVSAEGKLQLELENETIKEYGIKEITYV